MLSTSLDLVGDNWGLICKSDNCLGTTSALSFCLAAKLCFILSEEVWRQVLAFYNWQHLQFAHLSWESDWSLIKSNMLFNIGYFSFRVGTALGSSIDLKDSSLSLPRLNWDFRVGVEGGDGTSSCCKAVFSEGLLWKADTSSVWRGSEICLILVSDCVVCSPSTETERVTPLEDDECAAWKSVSTTELFLWFLSLTYWWTLSPSWASKLSEVEPFVFALTGRKFSNKRLFCIQSFAAG